MDGLNHRPISRSGDFTELIAGGLILWRLSSAGQADLWCLVFEHPRGLCFVLDDDPEGTKPYKVCEEHSDIVALMNRADALKASLVACGWADVDVE